MGNQTDPGGVATFGTTLYYIGNGEDGDDIYVTRADLTTPRNLKQKSVWSSEKLSAQQIAFTNTVQPQTGRRTGLASLPAAGDRAARLYLFWSDSGHNDQCYATWTESAHFSGPSQWVQGARLYTSTAYSGRLVATTGGVNLIPWGDKLFLVYLSSDAMALNIALFDPADISPRSTEVYWAPNCSTSITLAQFQRVNGGLHRDNGKLAGDVSATWISYGAEDNRLVVALYNGEEHQAALYALPFGSNGQVGSPTYYATESNVYQGAFVQRDPAGRLRLYFADKNHQPRVVTVSTDTDGKLTLGSAASLNGQDTTIQNAMPVTFYYAPATDSGILTYEIAVYGEDDDSSDSKIKAQIAEYGTVSTQTDVEEVPFYQLSRYRWVVSGIMDPFPLATSDVAGIDADRAVMATVYGVTESRSTTHTVQTNSAVGMKTSGQITVGVGVAWDISASAGPTQTTATGTRLTETKSHEGYAGTTSQRTAGADIAYFLAGLGIARDACNFTDMYGRAVTDGLQMTTIYPKVLAHHDSSTPAYTAIAGDLLSWTADGSGEVLGINQRMDQLFPQSSDYRKNYPFSNYVRDVIEANALPLGPNNAKCLMVSLGPASVCRDSYEAVKVDFVETGWAMTSEAYAGVAEAFDVKFFDMGFESTMQALVGVSFSVQDTTQTEQSRQWAVAVQPQTAAEQLLVHQSYTAKMYLLPASTRWVEELRAARPDDDTVQLIDPASAPWRIVYVVELG